jgi:hypothetical protein
MVPFRFDQIDVCVHNIQSVSTRALHWYSIVCEVLGEHLHL